MSTSCLVCIANYHHCSVHSSGDIRMKQNMVLSVNNVLNYSDVRGAFFFFFIESMLQTELQRIYDTDTRFSLTSQWSEDIWVHCLLWAWVDWNLDWCSKTKQNGAVLSWAAAWNKEKALKTSQVGTARNVRILFIVDVPLGPTAIKIKMNTFIGLWLKCFKLHLCFISFIQHVEHVHIQN